MKPEELLDLFSETDADLLRRSETATLPQKRRTPLRRSQWGMVACYFLISAALFFTALHFSDTVPPDAPSLGDSSVSATDTTPADTSTIPHRPAIDLSQYTPATVEFTSPFYVTEGLESSENNISYAESEDEFFLNGERVFFRGKVIDIQYIKVDFSEVVSYYPVLSLEVYDTYRGKLKTGSVVRVLADSLATVDGKFFTSVLEPGVEGIFIPVELLSRRYMVRNRTYFDVSTVADLRLAICVNSLFLSTSNGVRHDCKFAISKPISSLEAVEEYIIQKIYE